MELHSLDSYQLGKLPKVERDKTLLVAGWVGSLGKWQTQVHF